MCLLGSIYVPWNLQGLCGQTAVEIASVCVAMVIALDNEMRWIYYDQSQKVCLHSLFFDTAITEFQ